MSGFDHIEAIAIAIESLGFKIGVGLERRARASFIEHSLNLAGYDIAPQRTDNFAKMQEVRLEGKERVG